MHVRVKFSAFAAVAFAALSLSTTVASAAELIPHQLSAVDGDYPPEQRAADEKTAATQGPGLEQQRADAQHRLKRHPATAVALHRRPTALGPIATHFAGNPKSDSPTGTPISQVLAALLGVEQNNPSPGELISANPPSVGAAAARTTARTATDFGNGPVR